MDRSIKMCLGIAALVFVFSPLARAQSFTFNFGAVPAGSSVTQCQTQNLGLNQGYTLFASNQNGSGAGFTANWPSSVSFGNVTLCATFSLAPNAVPGQGRGGSATASYTNSGHTGGINLTANFSGSVAYPGVTGFVNPKYVIVGVTYAPPGPSSNVTYADSTFVGNTITIGSSFSNDVTKSISVTKDISAWKVLGGAGVKIINTASTEYIQGSSTSTTNTISKQTSVSYMTNGTGDAFNPVNHDYDTIWLWLNPLMIFTVQPNNPVKTVQWTGYGYDNHDVNGPDVFGVQVGWLNGHFGPNPSIAAVLSRNWVTQNEPGMVWSSGEGPGLTSNDIANILKADFFTSGTYSLPSPLPSTSADGRFTQIAYPPNPVNYTQAGLGNGGGTTTVYDAAYTNTKSVAQGTSYTFKEAFGTSVQFSGGSFLGTLSVTLAQSQTLTWTHTWENTLTTSQVLSKALSVTGPGCPQISPPCVPTYAGPGEFIVFQDNQYGTFMFYPKN